MFHYDCVRRLGAVVSLCLALLMAVSVCVAQMATTGTGTISGTVTDASGAMVPQAAITIRDAATGVRNTTETNVDGSFVVPGLPVGTYTATVTKQGFQSYTESGIILHPAQVTAVHPVLRVGETTTRIVVKATATQVQTITPEVSSVVSGDQAATLPLNGRNFESLSALMPGVTNLQPGNALGPGGCVQSNTMSVNGMGTSGSAYLLDGIWNIDTGAMDNLAILPNPDTIQEIRVLQNNYGVQYNAFGASVVLVQTKSGTSAFHGSAYDYFRNDALDARNFFASKVSPLKQNFFGFTLGGPFYIPHLYNTNKQKTFFFFSEQWLRQEKAAVYRAATPTAAMRNGTFTTPITNPLTGQLFPQTSPGQYQIPQSMINPNSVALMNALFQQPNNPGGGFRNYLLNTSNSIHQPDYEIKVDQNFNPKLRLTAEFLGENQLAINPKGYAVSAAATNSWNIVENNYIGQIQLTATLSPSMVNTTSIATSQEVGSYTGQGLVNLSQVPDFHEKLPFDGFLSDRLPELSFSGGYGSVGVFQVIPLFHAGDLEDVLSDDWSWLHGKHYIQAGGMAYFGTKRQNDFSASNGSWFFSGQSTGDPIADFLLGDATTFTQANSETRPYSQYTVLSPYVQDQWKATRRLTITAGMRLLYEPVPHAQRSYVTIFDPAKYNRAAAPIVNPDGTITPTSSYNPLNGLIFNGVNGVPLNFTNQHQYYWAPSVGFAWDVFGDGKTALRGGYGITYTRVVTGTDCSYFCGNNPPRIETISLINPKFPDPTGAEVAPATAPSLLSQDPDLQSAQIQTYSLSLEHQFGGNWLASIAGAGNIARHVGGYWDRNQPLPDPPYDYNPIINSGAVFPNLYSPYYGYGSILTNTSNMNMYWNALEMSLRHPVGHNLFLTAAYTWQHALSQQRGVDFFANTSTTQDVYHPGNDYGSANLNAPQILAVSAIWALPWYRNARGFKRLALGGWKYSDITTIQSGFSFDPGLSVPFQGLAIRPDRVAGAPIQGPRAIQQWFNTNAFVAPPAGYFGNAGPGIIGGPGLINFDMAFYKDFHITENALIEFRGELFNIFNHTNFSSIDTTLGSGSFGEVTGARDPRIAEFALRLQF